MALGHFPADSSDALQDRNLTAMWRNYATADITRLLVAEALDTDSKRQRLQRAIPGAAGKNKAFRKIEDAREVRAIVGVRAAAALWP